MPTNRKPEEVLSSILEKRAKERLFRTRQLRTEYRSDSVVQKFRIPRHVDAHMRRMKEELAAFYVSRKPTPGIVLGRALVALQNELKAKREAMTPEELAEAERTLVLTLRDG